MDVDEFDDVYISGHTTEAFFGSNLGGYDIILIKLSGVDGSLIFGSRLGTNFNEEAKSIKYSNGMIFIGGITFNFSFPFC